MFNIIKLSNDCNPLYKTYNNIGFSLNNNFTYFLDFLDIPYAYNKSYLISDNKNIFYIQPHNKDELYDIHNIIIRNKEKIKTGDDIIIWSPFFYYDIGHYIDELNYNLRTNMNIFNKVKIFHGYVEDFWGKNTYEIYTFKLNYEEINVQYETLTNNLNLNDIEFDFNNFYISFKEIDRSTRLIFLAEMYKEGYNIKNTNSHIEIKSDIGETIKKIHEKHIDKNYDDYYEKINFINSTKNILFQYNNKNVYEKHNGLLKLVFEKYCSTESIITERFYRSIANNNIVVPFGYKGIINDLKNKGYDMFDDYIDYNYDNFDHWRKRIYYFIETIKSLNFKTNFDSSIRDRVYKNSELLKSKENKETKSFLISCLNNGYD